MPGVVADDDGDELRPLSDEPARGRIGAVPDRARDAAYALARLDADVGAIVQHPRDRGDRDARLLGDVSDGGPAAHELLTNSGSGSHRLRLPLRDPPTIEEAHGTH